MVTGLESGGETLKTVLQHKESIEIPLYQRHYRWKDDKIETLWNDIIASIEEPSGSRTLFLGPTVFHNEEDGGGEVARYLVDGQQRLTTLSLITAFLFHKLAEVELSSAQDQQAGATRIALGDMIFSTGDDPMQLNDLDRYNPRLKLAKRDRVQYRLYLKEFKKTGRNTYLKMAMRKVEDLVEGEVEDRIREDLDLKYDQEIPEEVYGEKYGPELLNLAHELESLFNKTASFAVVEISDPFDPLSVFESLNSKGMPLAESDLIKNVLIQRVPEDQREEVSDRWDVLNEGIEGSIVPFLRYWYISEEEFIRKKQLYSRVKMMVSDESDVYELLEKWEESLKWYNAIRSGIEPPKGDSELEGMLDKYSELGFRQGIPILLAFASADRIQQMKEAIPILNTMYIRLFVTASVRGSVVENNIDEICQRIRDSDRGLKRLEDEARRLIMSYCPKMNWRNLTVSNSKTQKFLLTEITRHQLKDPAKTLPSPARLQIEHVLPQNREEGTYDEFDQIDHEHLVDHIGNLALLLGGDNESVTNNPFDGKKAVYKTYDPESPPRQLSAKVKKLTR